jgi:hypothetical protein
MEGKIKSQIKKIKGILEDQAFEGNFISDETLLVLENQLVILEALKDLKK